MVGGEDSEDSLLLQAEEDNAPVQATRDNTRLRVRHFHHISYLIIVELERFFQHQSILRTEVETTQHQILPKRQPRPVLRQIPDLILRHPANIISPVISDGILHLRVDVDVVVGAGDGVDGVALEEF